MDDVSVVISTYSEARWQDLVAAVESVRGQNPEPGEIVVVVDHSPTIAERARAAFPFARVVENQAAPGVSNARNAGIAACTGAIVAFLDDDAIAGLDWLQAMLESYGDRRVVGVGGFLEPLWEVRKPSWFPPEFNWVVGCSYSGQPTTRQPVRNVFGANMSFRREILDEVGAFAEDIGRVGTRPVGGDETELCIRIARARPNAVVIYDPGMHARHRVPASRTGFRYFVQRCWSEGISKAQIAALVGQSHGLATERTYTVRVLPRGVLRGFRDALRGDVTGLLRSGAILSGVLITTAGYARGSLQIRRAITFPDVRHRYALKRRRRM